MASASPLSPTFYGHIASTQDALLLFEACLSGTLNHVARRPHDREWVSLIKRGNVFIYEEHSSGIKSWSDSVLWSPSRILGNFLVYLELERPFPPGDFKEKGLIKKTISVTVSGISHYLISYYTISDVMGNKFHTPSKDPRFQHITPRPDLITKPNFKTPVNKVDLINCMEESSIHSSYNYARNNKGKRNLLSWAPSNKRSKIDQIDSEGTATVHTSSDSSQLYFQFCEYRWAIAIEWLTALGQILDGKQVPGWLWNSPLLGENFEEIRQFLQETREQLGMTGNNAPIPTKSKSNAIDLKNCAGKKLGLYTFGLCQASKRLALGVQQQQDKAGFDARLAQSTFKCVDYILRLTYSF